MTTIRVERTLQAPIERVFEVLTDHANYDRFRGIRGSGLLRKGESDPNGVGALRKVDVPPLHFEEEVNLPFEHEGGSIRLEPRDGTTHALWTSTYRVPTPVVGGLLALPLHFALRRGFNRVLEDTERMASD
jgi:Polyketide cyclase / dehydrase and lipid transport